MSTSVTTIISDAYRELNLTALGASPTTAETAEGLVLLNRFIDSLFGDEMGENLVPIAFGLNNVKTNSFLPYYYADIQNTYLPVNTRLLCNLQSASQVNMHPQPFDGSRMQFVDVSGNFTTYPLTVYGNGRNILGNPSITLGANNYNQFFFYRADTANWVIAQDLQLTDVCPFGEEFDDMIIIGLADRIAVRNGMQLSPESAARFKKVRQQFFARYAQMPEVGAEQGLIRIPSNKIYRTYPGYDMGSFQRGIPLW